MSVVFEMFFSSKVVMLNSTITPGLSFRDVNIPLKELDMTANNSILGNAIKQAAAESTSVDDDNRLDVSQQLLANIQTIIDCNNEDIKRVAKAYGYKSKKKLEQDLMKVGISYSELGISFTPCRTLKDSYTGIENLDDINLPLSATDEEIGIAARKAMSLCTSIYK